jgi:uncharacterized protein (TIGR02217 family)
MALSPPYIFPTLVGLGWSVMKTPHYQTRIRRAASGNENRSPDFQTSLSISRPVWEFSLTYNFLRGPAGAMAANTPAVLGFNAYTGAGWNELGTLHGFITNTRGPFYTFFYDDVTDDVTTGAFIGTGDGATVDFQLYRYLVNSQDTLTSSVEPVTAPRVVNAVYIDGVFLPTNQYSVDKGTGVVTFVNPPLSSAIVTADFTYWFRCRFTDDAVDFEEFMYLLTTTGVKFASAIGDTTQAPA